MKNLSDLKSPNSEVFSISPHVYLLALFPKDAKIKFSMFHVQVIIKHLLKRTNPNGKQTSSFGISSYQYVQVFFRRTPGCFANYVP